MILTEIATAVCTANESKALGLTETALADGMEPEVILFKGLCLGMEMAGDKYAHRSYFVPDMVNAATVFNLAMERIAPLIAARRAQTSATGVIGLVKGNSQDNGKNIVRMMLAGSGYRVRDLGKSVPGDRFVEAARGGVDFIGLSVMTSSGLRQAREVVQGLKDNNLRRKVKVMVGGAAIADEAQALDFIGADGYGRNAREAVCLANDWFRSGS